VRLSVVIVTLPWWTTGQRGGANLAAVKTGDRSPKFQFGRSIINRRKSQRAPYDYNELRTVRRLCTFTIPSYLHAVAAAF